MTTVGSLILASFSVLLEATKKKLEKQHYLVLSLQRTILYRLLLKETDLIVITYDRNIVNAEKKIDTDIVATMIEDSYEVLQAGDEVTLVSGDSDYVPAIEKLKRRGIPVHIVFWKHASREIKEAATSFIELDQWLEYLKRQS